MISQLGLLSVKPERRLPRQAQLMVGKDRPAALPVAVSSQPSFDNIVRVKVGAVGGVVSAWLSKGEYPQKP